MTIAKKKTSKKAGRVSEFKQALLAMCPSAGEVIAEARRQAGLTQVQLATNYEIGQNRESAIEKSDNLNWQTMFSILLCCKSTKAPGGFTLVLKKNKEGLAHDLHAATVRPKPASSKKKSTAEIRDWSTAAKKKSKPKAKPKA